MGGIAPPLERKLNLGRFFKRQPPEMGPGRDDGSARFPQSSARTAVPRPAFTSWHADHWTLPICSPDIMAKSRTRTQYAALPFRMTDDGLKVLLITSRETRRWVIPKGWPEKDVAPHELAAREAYEEAGIAGRIEPSPAGAFRYDKRLSVKKAVPVVVDVYLLEVERELDDWPEKGQRERRWMSPAQAALLVGESGLIEMLLRLGAPSD
jgi:8-oxo-dGTP pyrophosphatase MutT (NUDIX family)